MDLFELAFKRRWKYFQTGWPVLSELLDMTSQLGLQVGSLVLVDDVHLSQLVQHLLDSGVLLLGLSLVGGSTQCAHSSAHSLCIVTVVEAALLLLTDSLQ